MALQLKKKNERSRRKPRQETLDLWLWEAWVEKVSRLTEFIYENILPHVKEISAYELQKILKEKYGIDASLKDIDEAIEIIVSDTDFNPLGAYDYYVYKGHKVIRRVMDIPPEVDREIRELLRP